MKKKSTKIKLYIIIAFLVLISVGAFVWIKNNPKNLPFIEQSDSNPNNSEEEKIDYFIKMAMTNAVTNEEYPLFRWDYTPVSIGVHDNTLPGDKPFASTKDTDACLNKVISEFNSISREIKLERTYWYPEDIAVAITKKEAIDDYVDAYTQLGQAESVIHLKEAAGFVEFGIAEDYSMNFTILVAAPEEVAKDKKCALLYHEMMHAFGFPNHNTADQDPKGVLTNGEVNGEGFSELDKMLIDTMYNAGIPIGTEGDLVRQNLNEDGKDY